MVALVFAYYVLLRSVLRSRPELRRCRTRCRHCRIFFLTDPRNARRIDLRCPFGCRQAHYKDQSRRRSTAYYQDPVGKQKKRALNARRRKPPLTSAVPQPAPTPLPSPGWPRPMVVYLAMVVGLIEGRPVSVTEILEMLGRTVRQRSMVRERRMDQSVATWHERPP